MKKTNFNESVERFKERIKTDKKFKTQFATVMVASVVVVATAITVPTVIHNNKIKAKEDTSAPIVAETETETVTIPDGVETTVDVQGNVVAVTNENGEYVYTTAVTQTEPKTETETPKETSKQQDASKPAANKPQNKKNNGSSNKNNGGNKGNAGNTGGSNNNEVQQDWRPVTEADVKSIVEEARAYAKSKGFVIDTSMTEVGTSWGPETGILYKFSPKWRAKYLEDLRYEVDSIYKTMRDVNGSWAVTENGKVVRGHNVNFEGRSFNELWAEDPATINIFYKYRPNDSEEPYYIYVVYA